MDYKRFRLLLLLRIIIMVVAIALSLYTIFILKNFVRASFALLLVAGLATDFYLFINRPFADLRSFLTALLNNDYSLYRTRKGQSVSGFYELFQQLSAKYHKISTEKEVQHLFLQNLVEQVNVGIICLENDGTVFLANRTLKDLLQTAPVLTLERLAERDPELYMEFGQIRSGEQRLVKCHTGGKLMQYSLICSEFKLGEKDYKLITLQNIGKELDEKEIESWQKLIRVLTHEIMNSVTPITSLTGSLYERVHSERASSGQITPVTLDFLTEGLEAIGVRSQGLLGFTQAFHHLLRIPKPVIERTDTLRLLERIHTLFRSRFDEHRISFSSSVKKDVYQIYIDPNLMEQAIINLVKNAIESLIQTAEPGIKIEADRLLNGRVQIVVTDNGKGIPAENFDKIFVPFFTTKEKGTGIGLSISRQIVQLHKGNLTVQSLPGLETRFIIEIP